MAKMIQVRNVRPEVHAELVRRAKLKGKTLTAYVEEILEREVARPSMEEFLERVGSREPVPFLAEHVVDIIRAMRGPIGEGPWPKSSRTRRRSSGS